MACSMGEAFERANIKTVIENKNDFVPMRGQKYDIVSRMAYMLGIDEKFFGENQNFDRKIFDELNADKNRNARIMRNLCILRNKIHYHFGALHHELVNNHRDVLTNYEYIPDSVTRQLLRDGVKLNQRAKVHPRELVKDINAQINNRIGNCKIVFPDWINWEYIRELFKMPDGTTDEGAKLAGENFIANRFNYPYQAYLNWEGSLDNGNILLNDRRFTELLYDIYGDELQHINRVVDVSDELKGDIGEFIVNGSKVRMYIDCENVNVFNINNMLRSLGEERLARIDRIVLINDINTHYTLDDIKMDIEGVEFVEYTMERLNAYKSSADIALAMELVQDFYEDNVDSFILVSSDLDYKEVIKKLHSKASFLVMVERKWCNRNYLEQIEDYGVKYCYLDEFACDEKVFNQLLVSRINDQLADELKINVRDMLDELVSGLHISMDAAARNQFYDKHLRSLRLEVESNGDLKLTCGGK